MNVYQMDAGVCPNMNPTQGISGSSAGLRI